MDHHRTTPHFEAKITRPDNQPARVDLIFRPTKSMSREELHKMIMAFCRSRGEWTSGRTRRGDHVLRLTREGQGAWRPELVVEWYDDGKSRTGLDALHCIFEILAR